MRFSGAMDSEGLDLDTVGLLAAVSSNPSLIVAKPFDLLPFIPGSNVKGFSRKVGKVLRECQGTLAVGVTGSSASTPNAEAVVDAASGPPAKKTKTDDGRTESAQVLPKRLCLEAFSPICGHRLTGVQTGMVRYMVSRFQTSFDPMAMDRLCCPMLDGVPYVASDGKLPGPFLTSCNALKINARKGAAT